MSNISHFPYAQPMLEDPDETFLDFSHCALETDSWYASVINSLSRQIEEPAAHIQYQAKIWTA